MTQNRLFSLKRLLHVQQQKQMMHEWQLSTLRQRQRALEDELASLRGMASGSLVDSALMADVVASRIRRKTHELALIEAESEKKAAQLLASKRRARPIETALRAEQAEMRRKDEAVELANLIERIVRPAG